MENQTATAPIKPPVRWMTTREVLELLNENGIAISFPNFRKRFVKTKLLAMENISKGTKRPTYRIKESDARSLLKGMQSGKTYYPSEK